MYTLHYGLCQAHFLDHCSACLRPLRPVRANNRRKSMRATVLKNGLNRCLAATWTANPDRRPKWFREVFRKSMLPTVGCLTVIVSAASSGRNRLQAMSAQSEDDPDGSQGRHCAFTTRGRPARSGVTEHSRQPGPSRPGTESPCVAPISRMSQPPGRSRRAASGIRRR